MFKTDLTIFKGGDGILILNVSKFKDDVINFYPGEKELDDWLLKKLHQKLLLELTEREMKGVLLEELLDAFYSASRFLGLLDEVNEIEIIIRSFKKAPRIKAKKRLL